MGTIGFGACMMCYWLKFGLQCSGIVWRHYYHHNLIMALYILCLWLCRYCTSAQPTVWGGTLADSSAWVPPIALDPIHEILDRGGGENNHTTALNVVHVTEKDDQVMTDHTGSYFMPIPPFFLLYIYIYIYMYMYMYMYIYIYT